jgi:hypothetical protein
VVEQPFVWCPVANVARDPHPEGPDDELRLGLKHFAPGAKLYCYPQRWGDGGERIRVLGRHRNGTRLVDIVIANRLLTNWRVQKVYNPHVVKSMREHWGEGQEKALGMLSLYQKSGDANHQ